MRLTRFCSGGAFFCAVNESQMLAISFKQSKTPNHFNEETIGSFC